IALGCRPDAFAVILMQSRDVWVWEPIPENFFVANDSNEAGSCTDPYCAILCFQQTSNMMSFCSTGFRRKDVGCFVDMNSTGIAQPHAAFFIEQDGGSARHMLKFFRREGANAT